jgi:hypothetical protein
MSPPSSGDGERPKWSITWLLRIQRTGRNRSPLPLTRMDKVTVGFAKAFPWAVLLLLLIEVGLLVWLGVLPR